MKILLLLVITGSLSWFMLLYLDRRKSKDRELKKVKIPNVLPPRSTHALIDYQHYHLTAQQKATAILMLALPAFIVGYIFYKSFILAAVISAVGLVFPRIRKQQLIQIRKNKLYVQFKQALSCLSSSMTVGKSIETAFQETLEDLKLLYPDPACLIVIEFSIICRKVENGEPIEAALKNFADRSHLEDVISFTDVFLTCKRTGGNLVEVMKRTSAVIGEKLEITQDINVMIAQKRFESRVLLFAPIVIVAVLAFSSPEYMQPMYTGSGVLIMSGCLSILGGCYMLTQKIMNIKV
ncbi:type II secretion system F family protein [Paenibacillus aceris]|uniref:Tight adherence protein B n=1 Tax=Paenibacillus aceris TaxID=869555 RepID=A0ABS4HTQ3_9BACL|nr:type II secretion system F family protein [Paenibacillus aceris]MBP1961766.1 tight adherence protein B [Paenibacillus aceris]NHW34376.1 pilus assembly protein TadB [Paenibacillus aceris]